MTDQNYATSIPPRTNVLVIDDDCIVHKIFTRIFRDVDVDVHLADSGESGLKMAHEFQPDIIFLDIMMGDIDGFEVCRRIRSAPVLAGISIIMLTALDDRESRLNGFRVGADDFVTKPFDHQEIQIRVNAIMQSNRRSYRSTPHEDIHAETHQERQQETGIAWSLVTITGTINSRHIRTGKDGVVRFSVQNSNGFFYIQCTQCKKNIATVLRQGTRVMVTGQLISFYDPRAKTHQTAIIAQSLSVIRRDGRTQQLLRNLKVITQS